MKIYLLLLWLNILKHIETAYVAPTTAPLTPDELKDQQENMQALEAIVSTLSNSKYIDVQGLETAHEVWEKLETIHGGDEHVQRAKEESLRGKFDGMKMQEGENIAQYGQRIKEVVGGIKGVGGKIDDDVVVSKILRTLQPQYAIRVSAIQELRSISKDKVTIDSLIGKLKAFELNSFDNSVEKSTEFSFKAFVTSSSTRKGKNVCQSYECKSSHGGNRESEDNEDQVMELEALLAKRFPRGASKYKRKLPLKCFSCINIGHIVANYPNTDKKDKFKRFKGKGRKHCYVAVDEGVTDE